MAAPRKAHLPKAEAQALARCVREGLHAFGVSQAEAARIIARTKVATTGSQRVRERELKEISRTEHAGVRTALADAGHGRISYERAAALKALVPRYIMASAVRGQETEERREPKRVKSPRALPQRSADLRARRDRLMRTIEKWSTDTAAATPALTEWEAERLPAVLIPRAAIPRLTEMIVEALRSDGAVDRDRRVSATRVIESLLHRRVEEMAYALAGRWGPQVGDFKDASDVLSVLASIACEPIAV